MTNLTRCAEYYGVFCDDIDLTRVRRQTIAKFRNNIHLYMFNMASPPFGFAAGQVGLSLNDSRILMDLENSRYPQFRRLRSFLYSGWRYHRPLRALGSKS